MVETVTFKEFEKAAWEEKATRYSDTWGTVTAQVNDAILDIAGEPRGRKFLDIGCGPGHLCGMAKGRGFDVSGADYSSAMVSIASKNYPNIIFTQEDAENLSLESGSFDVVAMNYLLLHVHDQEKTLLEGKRILKPGGTLIYSNWLPPAKSPGLNIIFSALKEFADMSVIPAAQDIFMFSDLDFAEKFLLSSGFKSASAEIYPSAWKFQSGDDFFKAVQAGTRMGGLVELQKPETKEKIRQKITERINQFKAQEGFIVPTPSLIVSAVL